MARLWAAKALSYIRQGLAKRERLWIDGRYKWHRSNKRTRSPVIYSLPYVSCVAFTKPVHFRLLVAMDVLLITIYNVTSTSAVRSMTAGYVRASSFCTNTW